MLWPFMLPIKHASIRFVFSTFMYNFKQVCRTLYIIYIFARGFIYWGALSLISYAEKITGTLSFEYLKYKYKYNGGAPSVRFIEK